MTVSNKFVSLANSTSREIAKKKLPFNPDNMSKYSLKHKMSNFIINPHSSDIRIMDDGVSSRSPIAEIIEKLGYKNLMLHDDSGSNIHNTSIREEASDIRTKKEANDLRIRKKRMSIDPGYLAGGMFFNQPIFDPQTPRVQAAMNRNDEEFLQKFLGHKIDTNSRSNRLQQRKTSYQPLKYKENKPFLEKIQSVKLNQDNASPKQNSEAYLDYLSK